jgi:beta-lactamase regulating signal transducer with metallopeptidase domain
MTAVETLLWGPYAEALGWTLLHFVWQGLLVGLGAFAARRALSRRSSELRYTAGCAALAVLVLLPVLTLWRLAGAVAVPAPAAAAAAAILEARTLAVPALPVATRAEAPEALPAPAWKLLLAERVRPILPWLVAAWLAGVALLSVRLAGGWSVARSLRTRDVWPVGAEWDERLRALCAELRVSRPVTLLESAWVQVPTVAGWLRPAILLPASALSGLSVGQLEAILAHELGHIRRHDYLVNLLQAMLETVLFYHPAVWWISGWVREERELCCDDLAVGVCGDPLGYAHALADLESLREEAAPQLVMAADGGVLLHRIRRLLGAQALDEHRSSWAVAGALLLGALGAALLLLALRSEALAERPDEAAQAAEAGHVESAERHAGARSTERDGVWCRIEKEGRVLRFGPSSAVQLVGIGPLRLYASDERLIELPDGMRLSVEGRPVEGETDLHAGQALLAEAVDGLRFWTFSALAASGPEESTPNLMGGMSLEPDQPTVLDIRFLGKGATFAMQPARASVVMGVIIGAALIREGKPPAMAIGAVAADAPAARAGLREGDLVVAVEGLALDPPWRLGAALVRRTPGDTLRLGIERDGVPFEATLVLDARELHSERLALLERNANAAKAAPQP